MRTNTVIRGPFYPAPGLKASELRGKWHLQLRRGLCDQFPGAVGNGDAVGEALRLRVALRVARECDRRPRNGRAPAHVGREPVGFLQEVRGATEQACVEQYEYGRVALPGERERRGAARPAGQPPAEQIDHQAQAKALV